MSDCANLKATSWGYTMFKTLRSVAAILLSLILLAIPTQPASAEVADSLTYGEFYDSPLGKELAALEAANQQRFQSATAIEVVTTSRAEFLGQFSEARIEMLLAEKSARLREYEVTLQGENLIEEMGKVNGKYYVALPPASELPALKNFDAAMSRLKKSKQAWMVVDDVSFDISTPDLEKSTFFNVISDPTQMGEEMLNQARFGAITKSASPENEELIDYKYSLTIQSPQLPTQVLMTQTFNAAGELISQKMNLDLLGISSTTTITYKITTIDKIVTPLNTNLVSLAALKKASHQISAEKLLSAKVKALTSKATALAKSAKKTLTSKHLVDGAKALKYTVTSIKNGVRLSAKYLGVEGRMCLVAAKGKVVATACS